MILVVGSGVAGLSSALAAADRGCEVLLVTPGEIDFASAAGGPRASHLAGGNTALAQGGIAAALGADDRSQLHAQDTMHAGAGLVDAAAALLLCDRGADIVRELIALGFAADRRDDGTLSLGLEAAHSKPRIVHAGEDRTGAALHSFLLAQLALRMLDGRVSIAEHTVAASLLCDSGRVTGAVLRNAEGRLSAVRSDAVVLATGGYAALYSRTSNHSGAKGQGVLLAARVGAVVADLEFVQFHPTVLEGTGFLVSEALRGAGAVLRNDAGERFMVGAHEAAELAPRDVVSRAAHRVLQSGSRVWLDATGIEHAQGVGTLARRFPTITQATRARGIDWANTPIAVTPAAHYAMGGVVTDLDGRTSVPGLFAAGEVASTGVHGANRLASNSLLEGLVFGQRAALAAADYSTPMSRGGQQWELNGAGAQLLVASAEHATLHRSVVPGLEPRGAVECAVAEFAVTETAISEIETAQIETAETASAEIAAELDATKMDAWLGIERDSGGIQAMSDLASRTEGEAAELASMIALAALAREESRGAHHRSDFAETDAHAARRMAWTVSTGSSSGGGTRTGAGTTTDTSKSTGTGKSSGTDAGSGTGMSASTNLGARVPRRSTHTTPHQRSVSAC